MNEWITTKEAGDLLGVNIRTIQRYVEKGKLKAKIISGKNVVKKEAIIKLSPTKLEDKIAAVSFSDNASNGGKPWSIPEGYLLIDKSTLESLREQIKKLTDSMGEMQLTQKLLIEKGLNLKDKNIEEKLLSESNLDNTSIDQPQVEAVLDTPIENVAKAHEEFFGKKDHKGLGIIWLIIIAVLALILIMIIMNLLASKIG